MRQKRGPRHFPVLGGAITRPSGLVPPPEPPCRAEPSANGGGEGGGPVLWLNLSADLREDVMVEAVIVVDRAVRRRTGHLDAAGLVGAVFGVRRDQRWWAGVIDGESPEGAAAGLRGRDVGVVVADPSGRAVVWIADIVQLGMGGVTHTVESIVPGCGDLWVVPPAHDGELGQAWRALRRAHARALLGRACGLPSAMCRRISGDDPRAVRRAVQAWLSGEETLAVQIVHSAVAARVARGEPGYQRRESARSRSRHLTGS